MRFAKDCHDLRNGRKGKPDRGEVVVPTLTLDRFPHVSKDLSPA